MAAPVSWATMHAASRILRSVRVIPVAFCESLIQPAGTSGVADADLQLLAQEVGDLIDRSVVDPLRHERLAVDARDHHRRQPSTVGHELDDVRSPTDAERRRVDEGPDPERLGLLDPRADDLVDHLRVGVDERRRRVRAELDEHVVMRKDVADLVALQRSGRGVVDRASPIVLCQGAARPHRGHQHR